MRNNVENSGLNLKCENVKTRIFVTLKMYTNDLNNFCGESQSNNRTIKTKCFAYPTQGLASECNGKTECQVKLDQPIFRYGFQGSLCDFQAEILKISYECIPGKYINFINPS